MTTLKRVLRWIVIIWLTLFVAGFLWSLLIPFPFSLAFIVMTVFLVIYAVRRHDDKKRIGYVGR
jgi:hypothetical protein